MLAKDYLIDEKKMFQCVSKPIYLSPNSNVYLDNAQGPKIVRNNFKILHQMVHNNESVFDYFEMLCIKGLKSN